MNQNARNHGGAAAVVSVVCAVAVSLLLPSIASAGLMIDFSNYTPGDLASSSQPAPNWAPNSASNQYLVADNVGVADADPNDRGVLSTTTASANSSVIYRPTDAQIGGNFATQKKLAFSFDAKRVTAGASNQYHRLFIANTSSSQRVVSLNLYGDGDIGINGSKKAGALDNLMALNTYRHFWGVADYATLKYSMYTQVGSTVLTISDNVSFENTGTWSRYGGYQLNVQTSDPTNNRVAFDNFFLHVPEPGTAVLAAAAVGIVGLRRRRQGNI